MAWRDHCVLVYGVRSPGNYFSGVTGWPPGSLSVSMSVCYPFVPGYSEPKYDQKGRCLPVSSDLHFALNRTLDQSEFTSRLSSQAEADRTDLWWIDPDGLQAPAVAANIAEELLTTGLPWLDLASDLRTAAAIVESEHDSFSKFARLYLMTRELGDDESSATWLSLAQSKAREIGCDEDPGQWQLGGICI